jgi:hypothetical protein
MAANQPAYVEAWDLDNFPDLDPREVANKPAFLREPVDLEPGLVLDRGEMVEGWIVTRGFERVAHALWESTENPLLLYSSVEGWISEGKATARQKQRDWRQGREKEIAAHPDIAAALEESPEKLYDRADLTIGQRSAMRLFCQTDNEGRFKGYALIAKALGIEKDSARDRVEAAIDKILAIGTEPD